MRRGRRDDARDTACVVLRDGGVVRPLEDEERAEGRQCNEGGEEELAGVGHIGIHKERISGQDRESGGNHRRGEKPEWMMSCGRKDASKERERERVTSIRWLLTTWTSCLMHRREAPGAKEVKNIETPHLALATVEGEKR